MTDLLLPGLPFHLEPSGSPACQASVDGGVLTLTSGPKSDMFIDPAGEYIRALRRIHARWPGQAAVPVLGQQRQRGREDPTFRGRPFGS